MAKWKRVEYIFILRGHNNNEALLDLFSYIFVDKALFSGSGLTSSLYLLKYLMAWNPPLSNNRA